MFDTALAALQDSAVAQGLRSSIWIYPLINAGHIIGLALLFGAIVPLDLRLLGAWPGTPLAPLAAMLVPMAAAGLVLAVLTGALLFATRPLDYVAQPLFLIKIALVALAVVNALALRLAPSWRRESDPSTASRTPAVHASTPWRWRCAGLLSIALWLSAIVLGRLIGYR
jgi:hypothetical protein